MIEHILKGYLCISDVDVCLYVNMYLLVYFVVVQQHQNISKLFGVFLCAGDICYSL